MKKVTLACLFLGLLGTGFIARAEDSSSADKEMRPYISAMYSYTFDNSDRIGTDAGQGAVLGVGAAINEYWGWEASALYSEYPHDNKPGSMGQREYGAKLDGLFFYSREPSFSPYFVAGGGAMRTKRRNVFLDTTTPVADAGLGFISYFKLWGADLGFRGDARYRHVFFDKNDLGGGVKDDLGGAVASVGLVFPFGKNPGAAAAVAAEPCADSDGDGVCDSADLCPGTAKGTVVDAKGCPKEAADGSKKKLDDVYFAFDKSDLADSERTKLDKSATVIDDLSKKYPSLKVDVSGHTDAVGTDGYNQGLSERRANSVKSYLVRKGVTAERINTFAFGESKPAATNETVEGRALNRRAEVQTHE